MKRPTKTRQGERSRKRKKKGSKCGTGGVAKIDYYTSATVDCYFFSGRGQRAFLFWFRRPYFLPIRRARPSCKRLVGCPDGCFTRVWMPCDFGKKERKCAHVFGSGLHINGTENKNNTCIWYSSGQRSASPTHSGLLHARRPFGFGRSGCLDAATRLTMTARAVAPSHRRPLRATRDLQTRPNCRPIPQPVEPWCS